ncbi:diguanylate cyclase [Oleiagrimonas sp. C23AA]|uniref:ligand-binding sensor domain-containing diguanylate cyclase n=1 Tax=Oleiagrimonas sp. C23AA TaxID=2719047 RepID=UPI00141FFD26|nr:diguanylate cyclase [Oleiagrimonas sp. C23AA]NII12093.1 diguanylate cyclase [Oleiagrimonas sp. C23AA]
MNAVVRVLVAGLGLAAACAGAQAPVRPQQDIDLQSFTQDQGLASLATNVMQRDAHGVLWVGTDAGLFRFDGHMFVPVDTGLDPLDLRVNGLHLAPDGSLWVATSRGLYRWRDGGLEQVAKLPVDDRYRLTGDGANGIYLRHQRALWHVNASALTAVKWPRALTPGALTDGPLQWFEGHLWTSCGAALCERTGAGTRVWDISKGVPDDTWISMRVAADGSLWVGGLHHLLHRTPGAGHFQAVASVDPVEHLLVDARGRVVTAGRGRLQRWNGQSWQVFGDDEHLQSAQVHDMAFGSDGALWLATAGRGVMRWRGYGRIRNWTRAQHLDSVPTWAIARDADGVLWLGNQRYGNLLRPGQTTLAPWPKALLRRDWIDAMALLAQGRRMWIVLNHGTVLRYDLDTHKVKRVARELGWAKFALFGPHGQLWLGTHGALYHIDATASDAPQVQSADTGLPPDTNYLGACRDAAGRLWLATSHGLLRWTHDRFTRIGLHGAGVWSGLVDVATTPDGRLWLASDDRGLGWASLSDGADLKVHAVHDQLLAHTALYALEVDGDGRLWAGSDAGMDVRTRHGWRRLDREDGLAWNDMSPGAFHVDADGSIWIGTSGGVSHLLDPATLIPDAMTAPVMLSARYGHRMLQGRSASALPWNGEALSVNLARTGLAHPGSQQLQYRLLEAGETSAPWESTRLQAVRFAALRAGNYQFQARWQDPALRAHSPAIALSIAITPPWWRSRWAWAAYGLLVLAAFWWLARLRHAHLLRRQAELERLVEERTRALQADKHALEAARQALQYEASHDALTGLLNRGAVVEALVDAMVGHAGDRRPLAVALIDLDHFKRINDTYGHLAGDAVLVQGAQKLRQLVGSGVALGRYGGEEFLLVWPGLDLREDLEALFAPVIEAIYLDGDTRLAVTCSIGVAWARHGDDVSSLLRRADEALYRAKQTGRARVVQAD